MTDEQRAAFVMSQSACALIEAMGMHAENMQREQRGMAMAYNDTAFLDLVNRYGIHHNAVLTTFGEV